MMEEESNSAEGMRQKSILSFHFGERQINPTPISLFQALRLNIKF